MGIEDKLNQAKGALKEGAGKLTGDKKTEIEGAVEKVVAKAKDGLEDAGLLYPKRGWIKTPRILSAGRACKAVCYLKPWLQGQQIWFSVIYGKISP